jgi:transketolase
VLKRYEAYGWHTQAVEWTTKDGHVEDVEALHQAIRAAEAETDRPSIIRLRTIIGWPAPKLQGTEKAHGSALGADEIKGAREKLGWTTPPFEVPADIGAAWRAFGGRARTTRLAWEQRLASLAPDRRAEFDRRLAGDLPQEALAAAVRGLKQKAVAAPKEVATRVASEGALEALTTAVPEMVGGSADLTGSNNTRPKGMAAFTAANPAGRFIHYGVREHAMASAMNGIALHGGIIPYSGTFLVFSDYARPAIRLAALMGQRVIHVLTHDSIGLGEDGPTHQPVEHLAALRAIPNLLVFRPCDAVETIECWQLALEARTSPSALALTRQNLPLLRTGDTAENRCAAGAYELLPAEGGAARVSLFASGSEVAVAAEARKLLAGRGVAARVVSVPCFELFLAAPAAQRQAVIGNAPVRIGIEAAIRQGWDAIIGSDGLFIGMSGFGASAPYKELYRHFGITPEHVVEAAFTKLSTG